MPAVLSDVNFWRVVVTVCIVLLIPLFVFVLRSKRLSSDERVEAFNAIGKIAAVLTAIAKKLG